METKMQIVLLPSSSESEKTWGSFLDDVQMSQDLFLSVIKDIASEDDATEVAVRLIGQGRSGAKVVVISFHNKHNHQKNWVIKIAPLGYEMLLHKEKDAIEQFVRKVYPEIKIRISHSRAIAYLYYQVKSDFSSWFASVHHRANISPMIDRIFSVVAPWYREYKRDLRGFFESHQFSNGVVEKLRSIGRMDLIDLWEELARKWPITGGVVSTICHGDLNQTNILLQDTENIFLIDFANTGYAHWATDFVRLERQLRFCTFPEDTQATYARAITDIADLSFEFEIPDGDSPVSRAAAAIQAIRRNARSYFERITTAARQVQSYPSFEQEYFHMLAFQQICLLASSVWQKAEGVEHIICESTKNLLRPLLWERPIDYFFGYFYCADDGRENILVRITGNDEWDFPLGGFRGAQETIGKAIDQAINTFINQNDWVKRAFFDSGYSQAKIIELQPDDSGFTYIRHEGRDVWIKPWFFKVQLNKEMDLRNNNFRWMGKERLFNCLDKETHELRHDYKELLPKYVNLLKTLRADYIYNEFGRCVLECVDVIVFREQEHKEGEYEFLMLERKNLGESFSGWEYPKGGLEYHETIHEGAMRELLEETGIGTTGGFRFSGYLGYQSSDVSWRGKKYDTLRVHAVTYLFYGRDEDIKLTRPESEGHKSSTWMSWQEARDVVQFLGAYAGKFFERWKDRQWRILRQKARPISLAFQITEECPLGCKFCLRRTGGEADLNLEQRKEIVDLLASRGILRLTITGGEPLLKQKKREVLSLIEHIHRKKIHTCLSTTGFNLQERDIDELEQSLDQLLLSMHSLDEAISNDLYQSIKTWRRLRGDVENILAWTRDRKIIVEISTVVSRINKDYLLELGEWLFAKKPNLFWRLDEYYANGIEAGKRDVFELARDEFDEVQKKIRSRFPGQWESRQIRFSTKESRLIAPDYMITPQGSIVTSANNEYVSKGHISDLLFIELKNRRRWSEYRDCLRTDWDW